MKNLRKFRSLFLVLILILFVLPVSVSANAPARQDHLSIRITNIPEGAVYADLLIVFPEKDPNYVEFQSGSYGADAAALKEITAYSDNGYQSFTIHYKNAKSIVKLEEVTALNPADNYFTARFCASTPRVQGGWYLEFEDQYNDLLKNYRNIKIALLDKDYKILSVSAPMMLPKVDLFHVFGGVVDYDATDGTYEFYTWYNSWAWIGVFFSLVLMLISIGIECLVAWFFGFKGKLLFTVLIVNFGTQIVMRLLHILLPLNYWVEVAILETLVYTAEFFIYKKCMKDASTGKLLIYTILANTLSLFCGLRLNQSLFGSKRAFTREVTNYGRKNF